jgi:hypothetical protein
MMKSALVLASLVQLAAQEGTGPDVPAARRSDLSRPAATASFDGSARQISVPAPRVADVAIEIDGRLDDVAWSKASLLTGFTQYDPVEGSAASEETHVRLLVTSDALYFGIRADDRSGGVRATLTERDGFSRSDDYVRVILDTFNDSRRAFVFMVNPFGIQGDGLWVEGSGRGYGDPIDWSPDFLWQSFGRVDERGYTVEVRIPLKTLRFPALPKQDWGMQVQRTIRRTGYAQSWAPITAERANRLEQSGSLQGLEGLDTGLFMEINPTVVGSRQGRYALAPGALVRDPAEGEFGLNLTYGLTSNLTLDGTVNPDFSQIEADAGQIAVNERFALFLSEQRPFFLEGTDVFQMPKRLVYTRSIVNPVGAAKISGKVGGFQVAYLGAVDEVGGPSAAGGASNPVVNLVRVKGDIGRSSTVGMVYTDRSTPGASFNRVAGADARLVLGGRYTVELLAAASLDGGAGVPSEFGSLVSAGVRRSGRNLSANASFEDVADDFRAGSGFIRRMGVTQLDGGSSYTFRGRRGALLESWGPSVEVESLWLRDDFWRGAGPLETQVGGGLRAFFRGNIGTFLNYRRNAFNFGPDLYDRLYTGATEGALQPWVADRSRFSDLQSISLRSWINSWETVGLSLGGGWAETPIFSSGLPIDLGTSWSGDVGVTLIPTGSAQVELGLRHVTIVRARDGSRYSSATIPRVQARYQITRALYVRSIGEYSSQERGDLLDPTSGQPVWSCGTSGCAARTGSDAHDFRLEGLLGFEPSPGTVVFFGYTRQFRDTSAFSFTQVRPTADGLFLKLSYRFRL